MKLGLILVVGLVALSASAQAAETYNCANMDGAGIYQLTLDAGTATLVVDGVAHTAVGGGQYTFTDSFSIDGKVFNTPTLSLPVDASMTETHFIAAVFDGDQGPYVSLECSR